MRDMSEQPGRYQRSFGGMLGGLFCAIVAPLIFDWAYEHPVLILAAALLVPQTPLVP